MAALLKTDQGIAGKKWEAKVSTRVEKAEAHQIWRLFKDFFGLHQWFPGLATCYGIHGASGELHCVRYCAGFGLKRDQADDSAVSWSKERLTGIDNARMRLSYEIVDCNIGFKSYVSTVEVVPADGGGCVIEWWFSLDPVCGWRFEDLVRKYEVGLQLMAKKMEEAAAIS